MVIVTFSTSIEVTNHQWTSKVTSIEVEKVTITINGLRWKVTITITTLSANLLDFDCGLEARDQALVELLTQPLQRDG
jgi:hypothetical protein